MINQIMRQSIIQHELIGLEASVVRSQHAGYIGIRGRIIDETKNTLIILAGDQRKCVPKDVVAFQITLPDRSVVEVDGKSIVSRPVDRVRKKIRKMVRNL